MHPILLKLGPVTLYSYGFMMALAFLMCYYLLHREYRKRGEKPDFASNIVFWAAIGGIVGAKLFYILEFPSNFFINPLGMIFTGSGLVFHGGVIGGAVAVIIYLNRSQKPILANGDIIIPIMFIGQAIGRIGCFLVQDHIGKVSSLPWAIFYDGALRHPIALYHILLGLGLFIILYKLKDKYFDGFLTILFMLVYGIVRFFLDFLRVEPLYYGLTNGQYLSIILVIISVILLIKRFKSNKKFSKI